MSIYLLIFILIFYLYIIYNRNSPEVEHFYTFFPPFYQKNIDSISKMEKTHNQPYFKDIFNYQLLKIGYTKGNIRVFKQSDDTFVRLLTKLIISQSRRVNIEIVKYDTDLDLIEAVNRNEINLANVPSITANTFYQKTFNDNIKHNANIRYIFSSFKTYYFMITRKSFGVESVLRISNRTKIGIINNKSSGYIIGKNIMNNNFLVEGVDYIFKQFNSNENILNCLVKKECDIAFITITFPSADLNKFFKNNFLEDFILLSIDEIANSLFIKNKYIYKRNIDLNDIVTYLPKSISGKYYTKFNPDFNMISSDYFMITNNKEISGIIPYILSILSKNHVLFNKLPEFLYNPISKYSIGLYNKIVPIRYSDGALDFLRDNGFITNTNDPMCKYFIGYENCNKKTLKNNGFL